MSKGKKFYITGLYSGPIYNDTTLPPIVSYGDSALQALVNTGCTVWDEDKWAEVIAGDWYKSKKSSPVEAAVLAERERCAKIVEEFQCSSSAPCCACAHEIAAKIREGL